MQRRRTWVIGAIIAAVLLMALAAVLVFQGGGFSRGWESGEKEASAASVQVSLSGKVRFVKGSAIEIVPIRQGDKGPKLATGDKVKLAITALTKFERTVFDASGNPTRQKIEMSNIKKNDVVSIDAKLDSDGALTAALVIVSPQPGENGGPPTNGYSGGAVINGIVESIGNNRCLVNAENGERIDVSLDSSTSVMVAANGQKPVAGTSADIIGGMKISVMGVRQASGVFAARQVMCVK